MTDSHQIVSEAVYEAINNISWIEIGNSWGSSPFSIAGKSSIPSHPARLELKTEYVRQDGKTRSKVFCILRWNKQPKVWLHGPEELMIRDNVSVSLANPDWAEELEEYLKQYAHAGSFAFGRGGKKKYKKNRMIWQPREYDEIGRRA